MITLGGDSKEETYGIEMFLYHDAFFFVVVCSVRIINIVLMLAITS